MTVWKQSRILRWGAALLVAVALYAALGFWVLPRYARGKAVAVVAESLHRTLTIGQLRFNPFTFEVEAREVAIADGQHAGTMVAAKRLYANFQLSSLWRRAYTFAEVTVEQPYANVAIAPDGSLNLSSLVPASDPKEPPSPTPALSIGTLAVSGGHVDFTDLRPATPTRMSLAPVDFTLQHFTTVSDGGGFQLTAASALDERFQWQGTLGLAPLHSTGQLKIQGLRAQTVAALLGDALPMQLAAGTLDLGGSYTFSAGQQAGAELDLTLPQATANALALRARGVDQDWIRIPKLTLDKTQVSLAKRAVSIDALRLQDAVAQLWLEPDGRFNLQRMFASAAPAAAATPATTATPAVPAGAAAAVSPTSEPGWTFTLQRVELSAADVDFQDRSVKPAADFHLKPLDVTVSGISQDLTRPLTVDAHGSLNGTGRAAVAGTIVPDSATLDLQADVSGLQTRQLLGYLPHYPALRLNAGVVAAKGRLKLQPDAAPGPGFAFTGQASLADVDLVEIAAGKAQAQQQLLSWKQLTAKDIDLKLAPDALNIGRIDARGLHARVVVEADQSLNLTQALAPSQATAGTGSGARPASAPAASASSSEMPIRIGQVALDSGVMEFADLSIDPNFQARIEALQGSIRGISTASDSVTKIDLKGQILNRYSPVTISGGTNLFAYDRHTDVTLAFRNIDLPIFNPYSGRFAGYAIAKGKLSTELHYRIDQRHLQADHHIVLDQLEWGDATDSKDKVSLPVRLATSLLKDRHGVIDLNLPVAGTLDDPTFRIGPVVWQVIKNVLVKAVTAPFSFLGSLFEGAEQAQFVDFAPGSAALDDAVRGSLASLAKGLVDRPNLKLDIPAGGTTDADAQAMALQRLQQALSTQEGVGTAEFDALDAGKQADALSKLYKQALGSKSQPPDSVTEVQVPVDVSHKEKRAARDDAQAGWLRQQLLAHYQPPAQDLEKLARDRADAVQDALLADGQVAPERIFIASGKAPVDHEGKVRLELGLQ